MTLKKKQIFTNLFSGIIGQVITIVLGIVLPRLFITSFGSEVNGLLSSVNQFYTYIGLLEAGVGTATLQALYKPIAEEDKKKVNSILSATNLYYYKTGLFYGLAVFLFAFIFPVFVHSQIDYWTVLLIILFSGLGNAIIYFFHGKYKILLNADGRGYIVTNIATFVTILSSLSKIILIMKGFDVVVVQFSFFIINILQVFLFTVYIKRNYKWINIHEKPDFDAISKKGSVLIHQLSYLVFSNTDIILLTLFCDLKIVSIYSLYNLLFSSISNLLASLNNSITYVLGQLFQKNFNKFLELVDCYELYYTMLNFVCYTIALLFAIPFFKIYTAGISDANYIDFNLVILFIIINILISSRTAMSNIINISGHFRETQNRSILESIINLTVSFLAIFKFGMYGVLVGTIIALLYRTNDIIIYSNCHILNRKPYRTYKLIILNIIIMLGVYLLFSKVIMNYLVLETYISLFISAAISGIAILAIFFILNSLVFLKSCKFLIKMIFSKF